MAPVPFLATFTGVDDMTDVDDLIALASVYPVEFGVLFTGTNTSPRYPGLGTVRRLVAAGRGKLRLAAHLCGVHSKTVQRGDDPDVGVPLGAFDRIQVNQVTRCGFDAVMSLAKRTGRQCIIQCRGPHPAPLEGVSWLFDASGGRGVEPATWPVYTGQHPVGYSGGISPDNVRAVVDKIQAEHFWLDAETWIRSNDRFDVAKCRRICEEVFRGR